MKSVLISIKPKWCELIASGKKTIEVRKTRPKCDTPFKCYIYCTLSELLTRSHYNSKIYVAANKKYQNELKRFGNTTLSGKVIGEFVCDEIIEILPDFEIYGTYDISDYEVIASCLVNGDLWDYGKGKNLYGFHISDLVIYDKPKELSEFEKPHEYIYQSYRKQNSFFKGITRPPQSWGYVEESKERAYDFCSYAEKKEGG